MLATGLGLAPAELASRVAHETVADVSVRVRSRPWGSYLVTGDDWHEHGNWLVHGHPTDGPWGVPDAGRPLESVVGELAKWGRHAISMCAGPVVALDLTTGESHASLNRILAMGPRVDDQTVRTTTTQIRPASPASHPIPDTAPGFRMSRLIEEIESHLPELGAGVELRDATDHSDMTMVGSHDWASATTAPTKIEHRRSLILHPANLAEVLSSPALLRRVQQSVVPVLAWRAERVGRVLHAPFLERTVLDQIGFGLAMETIR